MHEKMNVLIFLLYSWKTSSLIILLSSLVFDFSSPRKIHQNLIVTIFFLPWAFAFSTIAHFCLSHDKTHWTMSMDNVDLKTCLLRTSNSMITLAFFLCVNRKSLMINLIPYHKFYRALGHLHGPRCKQPLRVGWDCNEEVLWSRILGEWSNMIGYEMGASLTGFTWMSTWQHVLLGEFSEGQVSQATSNPPTNWPLEDSNLRFYLKFYIVFYHVRHTNYCLK